MRWVSSQHQIDVVELIRLEGAEVGHELRIGYEIGAALGLQNRIG